jgi:hypothetical protein
MWDIWIASRIDPKMGAFNATRAELEAQVKAMDEMYLTNLVWNPPMPYPKPGEPGDALKRALLTPELKAFVMTYAG